jgi:hypothetical protein
MAKQNQKKNEVVPPPAGISISWSAEPASILEVGISWNGSNHHGNGSNHGFLKKNR